MANPVNVAVVGYGMAGKILHSALISATPGLRLHTVVSSDPAKVHADHPDVAVVADLADALADPAVELVVIATPDHLHKVQALAALDAGKHVVVDKPFAITLGDAREIVDRAAGTDRLLSVFQNRRWDGDFLTVKRLIAEGVLGEIKQYDSSYNRFRPVAFDLWKDRREAGVWQDLGPHLVDQALHLFDLPIAVYADFASQKPNAPGGDYIHAVLRYETLRVILHGGQMTPEPGPRFAVHGTGGSYVKHGLDTQEVGLKAGDKPGSPGWGAETRPGVLTPAAGDVVGEAKPVAGEAGNYPAYYAAVARALREGAPNPVTPQEALNTMRVLEAGKRSNAERREIALAEV